jgi:AcrR family transcriptional regulator
MARLRSINQQELMKATEELLLEKGYDGLHFKLLAERLGVGRSTIYEYFSNKDELVASYMVNLMNTLMEKCLKLDDSDPIQQLKDLLTIFISYSHIHKFIQYIPHLKTAKTSEMERQIEKLDHDHRELFSIIVNMIKRGQSENLLRNDLPPEIITSIFFNSIQIPRTLNVDPHDWSEKLFSVIFYGIKAR